MKTITIEGHKLVSLEQAYQLEQTDMQETMARAMKREMLRERLQQRIWERKLRHR